MFRFDGVPFMRIRHWGYYICFCLLSAPVFGQTISGSIAGTVAESGTGEAVIGISVMLFEDSVAVNERVSLRGVSTNKFGFFSLPNIPYGQHFLVVRGVGFRTLVQKVHLSSENNQLLLTVRLESEPILLQEIEIRGERQSNSTSTVNTIDISPKILQQLPSLGGEIDLFRTLQLLPGVKTISEISSGLYVRGGSPDQNLNLLDGVIVYNPSHLAGFISTFNPDALHNVRLIKGAFPAEYGGRLSSVIDITMKEGSQEKVSGAGGISMLSSRLTVEGPINDESTFMISGRRVYFDLLLKLFGKPREAPTYYFYDFNMKANYRLSETDRIYVSGYLGDDVLEAAEEIQDQYEILWGNRTGSLRWMHIVSANLLTNITLSHSRFRFSTRIVDDNSFGDREDFSTLSQVNDYTIRGEVQYFPNETHTFKTGGEITWHSFRAAASMVREFLSAQHLTSLDASVFVQDEWKISQQFSTNLGLRAYYFKSGNYLQMEPRLSVSYSFTDQWKMNASSCVAHQFLHLVVRNDIVFPTDLWFPSTSTIPPGKSVQYTFGMETTVLGDHFLLGIEGYHKQMSHLLEYKPNADFSIGIPLESQFTKGSGRSYGIEFFLNRRVGELTGWIGYTLSWTTRTFAGLNKGKPFSTRYDTRHDISAVAAYRLGERWELGATWVYRSGQAYTSPTGQYYFLHPDDRYIVGPYLDYSGLNSHRLPAFHKLDLNFMYKFRWFDLPFQLAINIYNAYNQRNVFAQFFDTTFEYGPGNTVKRTVKARRITLFPFLPTLGLSFKF